MSARASSARLVAAPRRPLELVVPPGIGDAAVDRMLSGGTGWIAGAQARRRDAAARRRALGLDEPGLLRLGGESLPLVLQPAQGSSRASARVLRGALVVGVGAGDPAASRARAAAAVERWCRREAARRLRSTAECDAARLGLRFRSLAVRDQRTRWGSCSAAGDLSFNWRLVLAPPAVLGYVVVHELCHLVEPNHSRAFWRLVDDACPGRRAHARWLRENGAALLEYSPLASLPGARWTDTFLPPH